jgi:hypothetical protein
MGSAHVLAGEGQEGQPGRYKDEAARMVEPTEEGTPAESGTPARWMFCGVLTLDRDTGFTSDPRRPQVRGATTVERCLYERGGLRLAS